MKRRKWNWTGYTLRREDDKVAKMTLQWSPQSNQRKGRPDILCKAIRARYRAEQGVKVLQKALFDRPLAKQVDQIIQRWMGASICIHSYDLVRKKLLGKNYQLTLYLSGHEVFRSYVSRFGYDSSLNCPVCTKGEEHVECPRYAFNILNGENIADFMLNSADNWEGTNAHVKDICDLRRPELR